VNGTYPVVYVAVDDKGLIATDTITVTVTTNESPVAQITVPSQDTTFFAWAPVQFSGTDSDADGAVASRQWDFVSPSAQVAGDTTRNAQVTYISAGTRTVKYSVVDDKNGVGMDSVRVTVGANSQPLISIISPGGLINISAGDSLSFVATDQDSDGSVQSRLWTYGNGSGLAQDTVAIPDFRTFNNQGTFVVEYRVVDNLGGVNADSVTVTVGP
jgi:hypothetical protein